MSYWDTSCLVKLYVAEPDSATFESHALHTPEILSSEITRFELQATLLFSGQGDKEGAIGKISMFLDFQEGSTPAPGVVPCGPRTAHRLDAVERTSRVGTPMPPEARMEADATFLKTVVPFSPLVS